MESPEPRSPLVQLDPKPLESRTNTVLPSKPQPLNSDSLSTREPLHLSGTNFQFSETKPIASTLGSLASDEPTESLSRIDEGSISLGPPRRTTSICDRSWFSCGL